MSTPAKALAPARSHGDHGMSPASAKAAASSSTRRPHPTIIDLAEVVLSPVTTGSGGFSGTCPPGTPSPAGCR